MIRNQDIIFTNSSVYQIHHTAIIVPKKTNY